MNVVVISAHPDDEALGAGGALLKHRKAGDDLFWIIVTAMTPGIFSPERIALREEEIKKAAERFGIKKIYRFDFPAMSLSSSNLGELIGKMGEAIKDCSANRIYSLNRSDAHSDHKYVFEAAWAVTKSFRYPSVKQFLMYECISETEFGAPLQDRVFVPNHYVDITEFLDEKIEICHIYQSEMGSHPFPRSTENIQALATFRGAVAGVKYAEAFQTLKWVE